MDYRPFFRLHTWLWDPLTAAYFLPLSALRGYCLHAPGLAVGLDPEGYGNPDFCWLSIYDTLIWSFAGPVAFAVSVSARE